MKTKDLKISEQTQMFIECIDLLNEHWEMVNKALSAFYGFQTGQQVMQEGYSDAYDKLQKITRDFLMASIEDKMGDIEFTEI